jgi:hypothetical protein
LQGVIERAKENVVRSRSRRGALVNFWRTVENFSVVPTIDANNVNTWAVSQAATMRRAHIKGNLNLTENVGANAAVAGIKHVVNGVGDPVTSTPAGVSRGASQIATIDEYP